MKNILLILSICFITAACSFTKGETTQQRLYGAVSDYKVVQEAALDYRKMCIEGVLTDPDCKSNVAVIIEINNKANLLIQAIRSTALSDEYSATVNTALFALTKELSEYLVKIQMEARS